jgi:cell division protein FtsI/penicillin-binding protein 2
VSSPASERRGHARPRRPWTPRPHDLPPGLSSSPGSPAVPPGLTSPASLSSSLTPPGRADAPVLPERPGSSGPLDPSGPPDPLTAPGLRVADPPGFRVAGPAAPLPPAATQPARPAPPGPAARPSPKPASARRRARRPKLAAAVIVAIGVLVTGLATGFGTERSAEPTVAAFLLDWQQGQYAAAAALTTGRPATVTADLQDSFGQVDATQLFLSMSSVVQHGSTARASYLASVSLAGQEHVWVYHGQFNLRRAGGSWKVDWAPSVIYPKLGPDERLAIVTEFPNRAAVLDAEGHPLELMAPAYAVGVWPDRLTSQAATARAFAALTRLQPGQVLGQIEAAPPDRFFRLATLDPVTYAGLRGKLGQVPGLVVQRVSERLFQAEATGLVGTVGSEVTPLLRANGAFYLPGTTVGLSGLEQAYQRQLLGTPTTEVVAVNQAGAQTQVLARWPGVPGTSVRTTIQSSVQNAALKALDGSSHSGEIVAVQASTGRVLAVAQRQASGTLPAAGPLAARLTPGTAFTIVSAAALLSDGLPPSQVVSCENSLSVGGQTFTSDGSGQQKPFSADFADDCGTAFVGLSERLSSAQFGQVVATFGIGSDWSQLPVPAFSGSVPPATGYAGLAAETIGQGDVRVSPLSMAVVAATVDSGGWHTPQVIADAADPAAKPQTALDAGSLAALRDLMRDAVDSGAARAARVPGAQVYGQVGLVHSGSGWTSWFVGYRGDIAFTVIETGRTARLSAAALAGAFLSALPG